MIKKGDIWAFKGVVEDINQYYQKVLVKIGDDYIYIDKDTFHDAKFISKGFPKPGEWTGPGLKPIYEVNHGVWGEWYKVLGEWVSTYGDHFLATQYSSIKVTPELKFRKLDASSLP